MQMLRGNFFLVVGITGVLLVFGIFYFNGRAALYKRKLASAERQLTELSALAVRYSSSKKRVSRGVTDLFTLLSRVAKVTGLGSNLADVTPSGDRGYTIRLTGVNYRKLVRFVLYIAEHYRGVAIDSVRIRRHGKGSIDAVIVVRGE